MQNTTNIIEALALGMLFGAVAGAVAAVVLTSSSSARRRSRDHARLVRMQRYLVDAQRGRRVFELGVAGYSRKPGTFAGEVTLDPAGLERLARAAAAVDVTDPPYSAAGGSFGVKSAPSLELVEPVN